MTKIFGPSMMGVLLSAIILNGCGTEPVDGAWGDSDGLVVLNSTVRFVFTESIDTFVAIVTDSDRGVTSELSCPDTTDVDSPITCFSGGIELKAPPERVRLVVKARGYAFASGNYAVDDIPAVGAHREASVQLTPLVPFEHTDTYASGFGKNDFDRFESLSVSVETALGPSKAVKFYIDDLQGTPIVYFQNTDMYPLHYLFAKNVLGDGRDAHTFEIETYTGQSRNAAAGVLIHYSTPAQSLSDAGYAAPVTLNFAGYDDISPGLIADVHRLIEERLSFLSLSGKQSRLVYMPAGDAKEAQANDAKTIFNTAGVPVLSQRQLWGEQRVQLLNDGVAFGILRRLTPEALEKTVVSFSDILILTRLPSTLPPVAGTITEEMQTPLSHVNIAAKIRGTPNMVYGDASSDDAFLSLIGQMVRFEIKNGEYTLRAATTEEAEMHRDELLKSRLTPKCDLSKQVLLDFETLVFGDADAYGTKSANLGALKTMLPGLSPDGFAVPFFYYEQFLTQAQVTLLLCGDAASDCEEEGRSAAICADAKLRCNAIVSEGDTSIEGYIDQLLENKDFLTNTSLREALLDGVRYHIRHNELTPETSALLIDAVEKVFGDKKCAYDQVPMRRISPSSAAPGSTNPFPPLPTARRKRWRNRF